VEEKKKKPCAMEKKLEQIQQELTCLCLPEERKSFSKGRMNRNQCTSVNFSK
jgi:hypothetical protein